MTNIHNNNKSNFESLRQSLYNYDATILQSVISKLFTPDASIQLCYPFETLDGPTDLYEKALSPLAESLPDLERRDTIIITGTSENQDSQWLGCCGYYTGTFTKPWLDIPPTGHQVSMRFHEFYRFEDGQIVEMQAIWDIPELMMQANAWPMVPGLGREWHVPGPASQDGISSILHDDEQSAQSLDLVARMCEGLGNYATGGVEAMMLDNYWHPKCNWYGPSGIGTARGISGFRKWHQIPFLNALPDRVGDPTKGFLFAENNYVGFTAWPGMSMTISEDGWLGIAPSNQQITMRSLDFWRCENSMIRENWVLIDLLDVYHQIGVDVFARMREMTSAKISQI